MRVRLGVNTCFAVKRWPRPADWGPVVRDRLGIRLVQHSLDLVDLDAGEERMAAQAADVRAAADASGLELHSTFTGLAAYSRNLLLAPDRAERVAAEAWFERAIRFTSLIGGIGTGGHVGAFSVPDWGDPARRAERWRELSATLARLTALARTAGQAWFLVENLAAAREPSTMAMIGELLTAGDAQRVPVRLCLDVGHMCVAGTAGDDRDPYAWLRTLGPQAPVVQLQQSDAVGDHHWPFTPATEPLGRIDPEAVLRALAGGGTAATDLILEVIPPFEQDDATVLDDMAASVSRWHRAIAAEGLDEA
jgi:sugar phosphate isomerase/epimerase